MNFSRGESITPSSDSSGVQGPASTEYSQRVIGDAESTASKATSKPVAVLRGGAGETTGGVLSIRTGELISSVSRATPGGLTSRSDATTRKIYLPSASASPSTENVFSCMLALRSFHSRSPSPRNHNE